ncbi:MAG: alpha/beta hydrolase [Gemmatimonadetes bacterium]|nr:alpha/beta hydrolase [Gemmatimonadota bacterium]
MTLSRGLRALALLLVAAPGAHAQLLAAPDHFVTANGASIRYRDIGSGDAVILLHGFGNQVENWAGIGDSLAVNHRVIVMDLRGFGKSTNYRDAASYAHMSEDVVTLMDELRVPRAHLVGHSMGAGTAARLALAHPSRFATASLISGFYRDSAETDSTFAPYLAALERGEGLTALFHWLLPALSDNVLAMVNAGFMARNDRDALVAVMREGPHASIAWGPPAGTWNPVVVHLIVGTADPLISDSRRMATRWSGAKLVEVAGATHGSIVISPETLADIRATLAAHAIAP